MAHTYKLSAFIIDPFDTIGTKENMTDYLNDRIIGKGCLYTQQLHIEQSEAYEWTDNEPENFENCDLQLLENRFTSAPGDDDCREIKVGAIYNHFKGHVVEVIAIAKDTENTQARMVVYRHLGTGMVWCRPYRMFASKVDKVKYPNVKQEYRFEEVKA